MLVRKLQVWRLTARNLLCFSIGASISGRTRSTSRRCCGRSGIAQRCFFQRGRTWDGRSPMRQYAMTSLSFVTPSVRTAQQAPRATCAVFTHGLSPGTLAAPECAPMRCAVSRKAGRRRHDLALVLPGGPHVDERVLRIAQRSQHLVALRCNSVFAPAPCTDNLLRRRRVLRRRAVPPRSILYGASISFTSSWPYISEQPGYAATSCCCRHGTAVSSLLRSVAHQALQAKSLLMMSRRTWFLELARPV